MKILFTGGSSFTGFWFIRELAAAGHEVTAIFRKRAEDYADEIRRQRVRSPAGFAVPFLAAHSAIPAFSDPGATRSSGTCSATTPPT